MPKLSHIKLTKRAVDATKAPARGEVFVWDAEQRGFGLRVYASGRRVFVFQYQAPNTSATRRLALGTFPSITVDTARTLARRAATDVAEGRDPKGDDADGRGRQVLADVFPDYLKEREGKLAPRTHAEYERVWRMTLAPTFGGMRFAAVDEATVARWHSERRATPILANRAVDLLSTFFVWAERRGYRAKHTNPCVDVERFEERRKSRSLTADEYGRLGSALSAAALVGLPATPTLQAQTRGVSSQRRAKHSGRVRGPYASRAPFLLPASPVLTPANPVLVAALRFLVVTGWREQEVLTLRWDAVNLARGVAVLTDTKSGRSERPLGSAALAIIRAQSPQLDNPYVFPGTSQGTHVVDPKRLWQNVKHAAALEESAPLRLHDLRHSFTTVARDELGFGDHVIARLVGHTLPGMTSRYGEVRDATVRHAADAIAQTIDQYLTGTSSTRVLAFTRAAR